MVKLADISNHYDASNYLALLAAVLIIEALLLTSYKLLPNYWGNLINYVYSGHNLNVVLIDIVALMVCFIVSIQIYTWLFGNRKEFSMMLLIIILIVYQVYRNIFYFFILPYIMSSTNNSVIDTKLSIESLEFKQLFIGDIIIAIILPFLMAYIKTYSTAIQLDTVIFAIYIICYILLMNPINQTNV